MTITRQIASLLVGLLFIFLGLLKVAPVELDHGFSHEEFKAIFNTYFDVLPIKSVFTVTMTPDIYMSVVGFMEVVCGTMLAFGRPSWQRIGVFYLLIIVVGAYIAHQQQVGPGSIYMTIFTFALGITLAFMLIRKDNSL